MKYIFLTILVLGLSCKNTKNTMVKQAETLGTEFKVAKIEASKTKLKVQPTLKLDFEKNTVSGNAGCNNYSGVIIRDGDKIKFEKMIATKMYCQNMNIEKEFMKKMAKVTFLEVKDDQILLLDKAKNLILSCDAVK